MKIIQVKWTQKKARRTLPCDKIHSQRKEVTKIPPFSTETTPFSSLKAPALAPQATYKRKFCAPSAKVHLLQPRRIASAPRPPAGPAQQWEATNIIHSLLEIGAGKPLCFWSLYKMLCLVYHIIIHNNTSILHSFCSWHCHKCIGMICFIIH